MQDKLNRVKCHSGVFGLADTSQCRMLAITKRARPYATRTMTESSKAKKGDNGVLGLAASAHHDMMARTEKVGSFWHRIKYMAFGFVLSKFLNANVCHQKKGGISNTPSSVSPSSFLSWAGVRTNISSKERPAKTSMLPINIDTVKKIPRVEVGDILRKVIYILKPIEQLATIGSSIVLSVLIMSQGLKYLRNLHSNDEVERSIMSNTKFEDVKGVDEAKEELEEIVHYLRDPVRFTRLGAKIPKGVLLMGPPGTGKTMLARAIAGEAGVLIFSRSGSEFDEMYVGVGASRVRKLFAAAKRRKPSPCIIFIDEIDAIGGSRDSKSDERMNMTLNQLLTELDGFKQNDNPIIVIAATNFPESLDKALVRPGRFDRHIAVSNPDVEGRRQILESHMRKILKGDDIDLTIVAKGTPGFSGAELANLVNTATLKAARNGCEVVNMADLEYAMDRIMMGAEQNSTIIPEETRKLTAYHETGHALVAIHTSGSQPIHKVTIVPRGNLHGMVTFLPETDETYFSVRQLLAKLDVYMGGRAAEEVVFGKNEITTGAASDLKKATSLARDMVMKYGMSERFGFACHKYDDDDAGKCISTKTGVSIEDEVYCILEKAYKNVLSILEAHKEEHHALANALAERGTMSGHEVEHLLAQLSLENKEMNETKCEEALIGAQNT